MIKMINKIIKKLIPDILIYKIRQKREHSKYNKWLKLNDQSLPPYFYKQLVISKIQQKYKCSVFIETGTYLGDMINYQKSRFSELYSIELGQILFQNAKKRFKKSKNIKILYGDSGVILHQLCKEITVQAIFWLDAHHSGGMTAKGEINCPIWQELSAIFKYNNFAHIILIDDADCFDGSGDYPSIDEIRRFVSERNVNYTCEIKNNIIMLFLGS